MTVAPTQSIGTSGYAGLESPIAYKYHVAAVFFVTFAFAYADRQVMSLLYEPIRLAFNFGDTQTSLLEGYAFALFYAVAAVPLGMVVDTSNRRNLMVAAVLAWSAATICCGFAHSFNQLFAARVGVAVGEACLGPAILSMIGDYFPPTRRARVIGLTATGTVIGSSLARIGGGLLLNHFQRQGVVDLPLFGEMVPWRAVFVLIGAPGVLVAALLLTVKEPKRENPLAAGLGNLLQVTEGGSAWLMADRALLVRIYFTFGLFTAINSVITMFGPIHLIRNLGMEPGTVNARFGAIMLILGGSAAWAGGWCSDYLFRRWGPESRILVALAGLAGAVPMLALPLITTSTAGLALMSIHVFFAVAGVGSGLALLQDLVPSTLRGRATALYSLTLHLIGSGGPVVAALASDHLLGGPQHIAQGADIVVAPALVGTFLMLLSIRRNLAARGGTNVSTVGRVPVQRS